MTPKKALRRIRYAQAHHPYRLDLTNCELTDIPPELAEMTDLKVL